MPDIEETEETEPKATETAKEADKYYNTWITITLDFGTEGTAVLLKVHGTKVPSTVSGDRAESIST